MILTAYMHRYLEGVHILYTRLRKADKKADVLIVHIGIKIYNVIRCRRCNSYEISYIVCHI
jgi:hypothetical protein